MPLSKPWGVKQGTRFDNFLTTIVANLNRFAESLIE